MKKRLPELVLSASRRTDIPAFYLPWFMHSIDKGVFDTIHPFTRQKRQIKVVSDDFHSIVFWSKNFGPFMNKNAGTHLAKKGFHLYFNFTVNSESILEPGIPPLDQRLEQIKALAEQFGHKTIAWRFDPICYYTDNGQIKHNLSDFEDIAMAVGEAGVQKCVTSFVDCYKKIEKRVHWFNRQNKTDLRITETGNKEKIKTLHWMVSVLKKRDISLYLCCERPLFSELAPDLGVTENACIDGRLLKSIFGGNPQIQRDYGQRAKQGCRCTKSVDIGSYGMHPCYHNCLFCYANPETDRFIKQ